MVIVMVLFFGLLTWYFHSVIPLIVFFLAVIIYYHIPQLMYYKFVDFRRYLKGDNNNHLYGIYGIVGEYGQGKTIHMCHLHSGLLKNNPNCLFISNFGLVNTEPFMYLGEVIEYYRQATEEGRTLVCYWDEIQNEFPENDKSFPPELRILLTQCRKNNGFVLYWSTQDYSRVNKNLRLMSTSIIHMRCLWQRLVIAKYYWRRVYDDLYATVDINKRFGKIANKKVIYVQSDDLRNMFDSYKMLAFSEKKLGVNVTNEDE